MRQFRILTWHVHGNYLFYLSQIPHIIYLPVEKQRKGDYMGKGDGFDWGKNVVEVDANKVKQLKLDGIIFQRESHYTTEQYRILSKKQLSLPKFYLEHNPPFSSPADSKHIVNDPKVLMVHVTGYNRLMWDCGKTPETVINHGVVVPKNAVYSGEIDAGIVVINHIKERGRLMGFDIFESIRRLIPLELAGMGSLEVGGLGEISHYRLPFAISKYRFFFCPCRYMSMPLAMCEAMMVGLPVVALGVTEINNVLKNGFNGYKGCDLQILVKTMKRMIGDKPYAKRLGQNAQKYAKRYFGIDRFVRDWNKTLSMRIK